jgi:hypothetical protein
MSWMILSHMSWNRRFVSVASHGTMPFHTVNRNKWREIRCTGADRLPWNGSGRGGQIRTDDIRVPNAALYQAELRPGARADPCRFPEPKQEIPHSKISPAAPHRKSRIHLPSSGGPCSLAPRCLRPSRDFLRTPAARYRPASRIRFSSSAGICPNALFRTSGLSLKSL